MGNTVNNMAEVDLEFINSIVFSIIGFVVTVCLIFTMFIVIKHIKPTFCQLRSCSCAGADDPADTVVSIAASRESSVHQASTAQYITLEDHLDILDTPEKIVPKRKETHGHTLEFMPDDNTVIQIEGTSSKITRITKTKITFGDKLFELEHYSIFNGELNQERILIFVIKLTDLVFDEIKDYVKTKDKELPILTQHPRYVRYLGTCFNPDKTEAYVISDYIAGCTLLDLQKSLQLRELLDLSEEDKVQAAIDIAEAVYYLHNLSRPIVHQHIAAKNIIIDGETLRARIRAAEIQGRLDDMVWSLNHGGIKDFLDRTNILHMELAPEVFLHSKKPDQKSDIWGLGAAVLEILFDQKLWNAEDLGKKFEQEEKKKDNHVGTSGTNSFEILRKAMEKRSKPSLLANLERANPKLRFLSDCFNYTPLERPSTTFVLRGLHQFMAEVRRDRKTGSGPNTSFIFPGRRIMSGSHNRRSDPLVRQQVDWNVRQETGYKRRAFLIGNRNYLGKKWTNLSANPLNDIKDIGSILHKGGYGTENTFENVSSATNCEEILQAYIDAVNREEVDVDIIVFYFSGYGISGEPEKLRRKKELSIFTDRQGILHDLALVMCNETLFPVAKMQTMISELHSRVKRKMIVLDCRVSSSQARAPPSPSKLLARTLHRTTSQAMGSAMSYRAESALSRSQSYSVGTSSSREPDNSSLDWELPKIPEETTEKLISMFILRPVILDQNIIAKAVDSHPRRMNGFLTGCLIQVLQDNIPNISDLPKFLNNQMKAEGRRSRAHRGIECRAEFSHVGNIWNAPLLTH